MVWDSDSVARATVFKYCKTLVCAVSGAGAAGLPPAARWSRQA